MSSTWCDAVVVRGGWYAANAYARGPRGGPCRSAAENYSTNLPPFPHPRPRTPSSQIIRFTCFLFYDVYITPTRSSLASASAPATAAPPTFLRFRRRLFYRGRNEAFEISAANQNAVLPPSHFYPRRSYAE